MPLIFVDFKFCNNYTSIVAKLENNIQEVFKEYAIKIQKNLDALCFLYNGHQLPKKNSQRNL